MANTLGFPAQPGPGALGALAQLQAPQYAGGQVLLPRAQPGALPSRSFIPTTQPDVSGQQCFPGYNPETGAVETKCAPPKAVGLKPGKPKTRTNRKIVKKRVAPAPVAAPTPEVVPTPAPEIAPPVAQPIEQVPTYSGPAPTPCAFGECERGSLTSMGGQYMASPSSFAMQALMPANATDYAQLQSIINKSSFGAERKNVQDMRMSSVADSDEFQRNYQKYLPMMGPTAANAAALQATFGSAGFAKDIGDFANSGVMGASADALNKYYDQSDTLAALTGNFGLSADRSAMKGLFNGFAVGRDGKPLLRMRDAQGNDVLMPVGDRDPISLLQGLNAAAFGGTSKLNELVDNRERVANDRADANIRNAIALGNLANRGELNDIRREDLQSKLLARVQKAEADAKKAESSGQKDQIKLAHEQAKLYKTYLQIVAAGGRLSAEQMLSIESGSPIDQAAVNVSGNPTPAASISQELQ